MTEFKDKTLLVTGAAGQFGRLAVAEGLRANEEDPAHPRLRIFSRVACSFQVREL